MEAILFFLKTIGIGLVAGLVVGFLSKKFSKLIIFFALLVVVLLQIAAYKGYIDIDWLSWKDTAVDVVKNTEIPTDSIKDILMKNIPFSVAAIIGFVFGFKKG